MTREMINTAAARERAILVGVDYRAGLGSWEIESSLDELEQLAKTAGADVVGRLVQKLNVPAATHYIGKGKLQELLELKEELSYQTVIFNDELRPTQQNNLEADLGTKIIDRTALILDIFAASAHTSEGKLQVELAQHEYLLPRLAGQWSHLERLGGGIGTRGPGEKQIETDRRIIRKRISAIKEQIEAVRKHRELYRRRRGRSGAPLVALVGYTNAGKSTLLNTLCRAGVEAENKLFSTLDPVTRRLRLPNGKDVLLTDTVGFIHKLPPLIVASFHATLEELEEADLLLKVVDITSVEAVNQSQTVDRILEQLCLQDKPRITVINKMDIAGKVIGITTGPELSENAPPDSIVMVSAANGWNLDRLLEMMAGHF